MHGHFLIMGGFTLLHADVSLPKKPIKPTLSFSFRFWRNADDERDSSGWNRSTRDEEQGSTDEVPSEEREPLSEEERLKREKERYAADKQRYVADKQRYVADKQRYAAENRHYKEEKQRYEAEKQYYEESHRGEEQRWQYERSRQRFEEVRQAYEEVRYLYEESWRRYQESQRRYQEGQTRFKKINRYYEEIQQGEEAKVLYNEQKMHYDEQKKKYEDVESKHEHARRSYEEATKEFNGIEEKKRLYREEEERHKKAGGLYKEEALLCGEATKRYMAKDERMKEEARQRYEQEKQQNFEENRQYEEEMLRYPEERERYEEARHRYEEERKFYEEERMSIETSQHTADELERRRYEIERRQYEERRKQFEEERSNEEENLRRYEKELHRYQEELREYEEKCQRYQLGPLSFDRFQKLVHEFKIDFPKITVEEIKDKSKADFLSKTIAILQTTWFLFQCVARGVQGLAITELELVTLALASLNVATYACWWNKPLGVQDPARIYLKVDIEETQTIPVVKRSVDSRPEATVRRVLDSIRRLLANFTKGFLDMFGGPFSGGTHCGHYLLLIWIPSFLLWLVALFSIILLSLFPLAIAVLLNIIKPTRPFDGEQSPTTHRLIAIRIIFALHRFHRGLASLISNFFQKGFGDVWDNSFNFFMGLFIVFPLFFLLLLFLLFFLLPFFALFFLVSFLFTSVFGIITTNSINPGATQVPSFYACKTDSDRYSRMIVFAFFGVIFGGLHCIGWHFTFPTSSERMLWRVTSLTITLIPLIVAPIDYFLANVEEDAERSLLARMGLSSLDLTMTVLLFAYVPARLSLIAQAFALLRIQPPSSFIPVDWTMYIPHILTP